MGIALGSAFESDVAALAGVTGYDPGSLDITLLNPAGATTVRFTKAVNVDTTQLKLLLQKYVK
jgi:hypothetical protein